MSINLSKVINNKKNYNYFHKSLKRLVLYKRNFFIFPSRFKVIRAIFSLHILLENKVISKAKRNKIKVIKKDLILKSKVFQNNFKYLQYVLEIAY
ncbi:hypothetical protein C8035_v005317 [Colletotrichum spinosum]|uniref:Uncharacterized protein n=1 Tax=Colletotrichum spinosum TaxID=1347390 RepID=A0A4R8PQP7_9PEZI|nr:hypothetical protein C8035_v005317 [Colletotrichum spinosum]